MRLANDETAAASHAAIVGTRSQILTALPGYDTL